ncbi:MAG: hypothetical protein ABI273_12340, partial [Lacunisphaera sp.]
MDIAEQRGLAAERKLRPRIRWSGIVAGAVAAAAFSFVLLSFASAIGLSVASTSPSWRDASQWLWMLSGVYLVFV